MMRKLTEGQMNCFCAACLHTVTGTCMVIKFHGYGAVWFVTDLQNKLRIENVYVILTWDMFIFTLAVLLNITIHFPDNCNKS